MYLLLALLSASPLSSFLQEAVERGDVAGVVALVISGDRVVYHEAFPCRPAAPQSLQFQATALTCLPGEMAGPRGRASTPTPT